MPLTDAQVEAAATHLEEGFAAGLPLAAIPEDLRPTSIEDADRIATRLRRGAAGPLDGWKAGASSPAQMSDLGVSTPPVAPLQQGVVVASPANLDASIYYLPIMEAEVAFRLGADLPSRDTPYSAEEVSAAIASAHIAIEAANFPFADGPAAGMPSIIAAGFAVAYLVVGPEIEGWRDRDLRALDVQLLLDGEVAATGLEGDSRCDPLGVLVAMANDLASRGTPLQAGHVVTTGAAAPPTPAQPGQTVTVRFGGIGDVVTRLA